MRANILLLLALCLLVRVTRATEVHITAGGCLRGNFGNNMNYNEADESDGGQSTYDEADEINGKCIFSGRAERNDWGMHYSIGEDGETIINGVRCIFPPGVKVSPLGITLEGNGATSLTITVDKRNGKVTLDGKPVEGTWPSNGGTVRFTQKDRPLLSQWVMQPLQLQETETAEKHSRETIASLEVFGSPRAPLVVGGGAQKSSVSRTSGDGVQVFRGAGLTEKHSREAKASEQQRRGAELTEKHSREAKASEKQRRGAELTEKHSREAKAAEKQRRGAELTIYCEPSVECECEALWKSRGWRTAVSKKRCPGVSYYWNLDPKIESQWEKPNETESQYGERQWKELTCKTCKLSHF